MEVEVRNERKSSHAGSGLEVVLYPSSRNGPHHAVFSRSGPLVVFFSGTNKSEGQFDFWGYAQRSSASCILLNNGQNRWYQSGVPGFGASVEGTADFIRRWGAFVGAKEIICIGASMGGSAAVLYGSILNARVLAFSFEAHIRHQGSRSIKYIPSEYSLSHPDLKPLIRQASKPITSILGGDDIIDVAEASRLQGLPNLTLTCLQGVDHGVPRHLRSRKILDRYLDAFVAGDSLPYLSNVDDDLEIPGYAASVAEAHLALLGKQADRALVAAERAVVLKPHALVPRLLAGRALLTLKRPAESLEHLGLAASLDQATPDSRLWMGRALRGLRRNTQAAAFHAHTLDRFPDEHRVYYDRALALWSMGEREAAHASIASAIDLAPRNASYLKRLMSWDNL